MGDPNGEPVGPESGVGPSAAPLHPPATQAQARAARAQALTAQAQVLSDEAQALAAQAQAPANRNQVLAAQALADKAQALAAQVLADQALAAQVLADQAQATATQALVPPNNGDERRVDTYKEIANLHTINLFYPIHKLALEEWQRKEEYLSHSVSRREVRSAELTNQLYNIFGWFAVFQGVVLTAVSQLTQTANSEIGGVPLCGKIWFPIVLTGFATVATIVGVWLKFMSLQSLEVTIQTERQAKIEVARRASTLRREGPQKFKFHLDTKNTLHATKAKPVRRNQCLVIVALLIFTGIFILSYFVILCDTWVVRK